MDNPKISNSDSARDRTPRRFFDAIPLFLLVAILSLIMPGLFSGRWQKYPTCRGQPMKGSLLFGMCFADKKYH
jgi:hypothetical protein